MLNVHDGHTNKGIMGINQIVVNIYVMEKPIVQIINLTYLIITQIGGEINIYAKIVVDFVKQYLIKIKHITGGKIVKDL